MNNRELAVYMGRLGFYVFPCISEGELIKSPYYGVMWKQQSTCIESEINKFWQFRLSAVPGIDMWKSGLIAIDCDVKNSDGLAWLNAQGWGDMGDIPGSYTPNGGRHLIFRNQCGYGDGRGNLPGKTIADIDVKGKGYIIAPGSTMADGRRYVPIGDLRYVLDMPNWAVDLLRPPEPVAQPLELVTVVSEPVSDSQRNAYGQAALEGLEQDLAGRQKGEWNNSANRLAFRAGQLVGNECLTEEEAYQRLAAAARSWGIRPNDKVFGPRGTIRRAIRAGMIKKGGAVPTEGRDTVEIVYDQETGEIIEEVSLKSPPILTVVPDSPPPPNIGDMREPVDWTRPEGLLDEMVEYILATSIRPNRPLAVAASVAALSTICGRWLYGPTGSSLNLYIAMLAGTAVGKNRPLSAAEEFLRACDMSKLHQSAKVFSLSAFEQLLVDTPCCLATADEIGINLMARMGHKRASTHEAGIKGMLILCWSREDGMGPYATTRSSRMKGVKAPVSFMIERPSLSIFGASTPIAFWESIPGGAIKDGFLNRWLLCVADIRGAPQEVGQGARVVPESIAGRLRALVPVLGPGNMLSLPGRVYQFAVDKGALDGAVRWIDWEDDEVRASARAFEADMLEIIDGNDTQEPLLGRVYEYAVRLATLHSVSRRGVYGTVSMRDWEWGVSWSLASAKILIAGADRYMAKNEQEGMVNEVRNAIREAGTIKRMDLWRKLRSISARDRDAIIKDLVIEGVIVPVRIPSKTKVAEGWSWSGE